MKEIKWLYDGEGNLMGASSKEKLTLEEARKNYPYVKFSKARYFGKTYNPLEKAIKKFFQRSPKPSKQMG